MRNGKPDKRKNVNWDKSRNENEKQKQQGARSDKKNAEARIDRKKRLSNKTGTNGRRQKPLNTDRFDETRNTDIDGGI